MAKSLLLAFYIATSLFGLYKLKTAEMGLNIAYAIGIAAYGASFAMWLFVLKLFPFSVAFPLSAGAVIVGTQLIGVLVLSEQFDLPKAIGIGLLLAGLAFLAYSYGTSED